MTLTRRFAPLEASRPGSYRNALLAEPLCRVFNPTMPSSNPLANTGMTLVKRLSWRSELRAANEPRFGIPVAVELAAGRRAFSGKSHRQIIAS